MYKQDFFIYINYSLLSKKVIVPNKKQPNTANIKKTKNNSPVTFNNEGIEKVSVAISLLSPSRFFTSLIKRETLRTLKILIN